MIRSVLMAIVAILVTLGATPASAQVLCGDHAKMVASLDQKFEEARSGIGLASNGAVVELYTASTGTWTLLITKPGGATCVIGNGEAWEALRKPAPATGKVS
ncbi:MAG: hypothetical protein ACE5JZ_10020 [Kiloniellales bacterium]